MTGTDVVEQARAEGRQEAVDRLRAVLPDTMELHSDYHGAGERFYRADDVDFALDAILDRVAGLDASEHPGEYEIDGMDGGTYRFSGDASDSGQPPEGVAPDTLVEADYQRFLHPMGQPSEASDE